MSNNQQSSQMFSDEFHGIEEDIRMLTIRIAEQRARANQLAIEAKLSGLDTQKLMNQLSAADTACNELASRMALSHTAAERIGEDVRADFPWDCPEEPIGQSPALSVVA